MGVGDCTWNGMCVEVRVPLCGVSALFVPLQGCWSSDSGRLVPQASLPTEVSYWPLFTLISREVILFYKHCKDKMSIGLIQLIQQLMLYFPINT